MRRKTLGFETGSVLAGVEVYDTVNDPVVISDGAISGDYSLQSSYHDGSGDLTKIWSTTKAGGTYFKVNLNLKEFANANTSVAAFLRDSDDNNMVGIELTTEATLQLYYRANGGSRSSIGSPSIPLSLGVDYCLEFGVVGDESGSNRTISARLDTIQFAAQAVTDQDSEDGYLALGFDIDASDTATVGRVVFDDVEINDLTGDSHNSWPGFGKLVRFTVTGDDNEGNVDWTRGGANSGSDWGQADELDPNDATDYLATSTNDAHIDLRISSPYSLGLSRGDTVKCVSLHTRARCATAASSTSFSLFARAGSNLPKTSQTLTLLDNVWHTGDGASEQLDALTLSTLPTLEDALTVEHVAGLRVGLLSIDATPEIQVSALWGYISYTPSTAEQTTSILIDDEERIDDVKTNTLSITDQVNEIASTLRLSMYDLHSEGFPEEGEVIEVRRAGLLEFAGLITNKTYNQLNNANDICDLVAGDYTRLLDRRLVAATYTNMSDKDVIESIISEFAGDEGIDTYFVAEGPTIAQITFNYIPASQAIAQIAQLTGRNWYTDYDKKLHYFPAEQEQAPFEVTSDTNKHEGFVLNKDASQIRNRVFVRGGTELTTSPVTETMKADGTQKQFLLAEKPHDLSMTVGGVSKTIGIKNVDDPASFDYLLNFQEKYVENGSGTAAVAAGTNVAFTYNYDVPVLISVEDNDSIAQNGVYEYVIIDNQIASTQQARDRATAELTDYAASIIEASYSTVEPGVRSGQYQRVTMANKGVDEDYVVTKVVGKSIANGVFNYTVYLSSARTLGIIKFLLEMLQVNRTVGTFNPNEKVDQLYSLTDTIDSIVDSLTIDSQGLAYVFSNDAGTTPGKGRFDLAQFS